MIPNWLEYQAGVKLARADVDFYGLIVAAMMRADSTNAAKLRAVFPDVWDVTQARYDAPGGYIDSDPDSLRGTAAIEKAYVSGGLEDDSMRKQLNAMGCTDGVDKDHLIAALDVIREYGAALPAEPANGTPADEKATQAQLDLIAKLARDKQAEPPNVPLTKQTAHEVDRLAQGGHLRSRQVDGAVLMAASIVVAGTPYSYETEANAGISLADSSRWWGTLVKYRPGLVGKWTRFTLVDVHPFDTEAIEAGLRAYIERRYTVRT